MSTPEEDQEQEFDAIISEIYHDFKVPERIRNDITRLLHDPEIKDRLYFKRTASLNKGKIIVKDYDNKFVFSIHIPYDFPFDFPTVKIAPEFTHLHDDIDDKTGILCLNNQKDDMWLNISYTIQKIIFLVDSMIKTKTKDIADDLMQSNSDLMQLKMVKNKKRKIIRHFATKLNKNRMIIFGYTRKIKSITLPKVIECLILAYLSEYGRCAWRCKRKSCRLRQQSKIK